MTFRPGWTRAEGKELFLKWVLLNAVCAVAIIVFGIAYGSKVTGTSLIIAPAILVLGIFASAHAGRLCWRAASIEKFDASDKRKLLHEARYIQHWAEVAPMIGILGSAFGLWRMLGGGGSTTELHARIQDGGVVFVGTFVGIFVMLALRQMKRFIEHELED